MKKLAFIILLIIVWMPAFAQDTLPKPNKATLKDPVKFEKDIIFSAGVIAQRQVFTEANIIIGEVINNYSVYGITGVRVGAESNLKSGNSFIIAPKIGYEISLLFLSMRLSALDYFKGSTQEVRLLPELGLSFFGIIDLTYGYNIRLTSPAIGDISNHRLALTINLNKKLIKPLFE